TPQESKVVNNDKVTALGMFRINPFTNSREEKHVPNNVSASARTKLITVLQPSVITKKEVNSDLNGFSSTGIEYTKTRRPQPRSNTKKDRVLSASKNGRSKNKEAKVEEHNRNLLLFKNKKHMSSACNNFTLDSQNVYSTIVCAMCKKCLISVSHDECLLNYVNDKNSRGNKQTENFHSKKNKRNKSRRWSPTGRMFDLNSKIIASSESESQSDCSKGDNVCTSNHVEPTIKRFPNATFSLAGLGHNLFSVGLFYDSDLEVLKEFFDSVGISHQMYSVRTPQQNRVVERQNRTLVEAARTITYNRRTKKKMETMNVSFDELSVMGFEERSSKLGFKV
nr:retrotransposon protein, putative, unclassified [Tanacetum cinerariifolium]